MKLLNKLKNGKALIYAHDKMKNDKDFLKLLFEDLQICSLEDLELVEEIFEYMDEDFLEDKEIVLFILQKLHNAVEILVNSVDKNDEEAVDDILDVYEDFFEDLDDDLRGDKEIVLKVLSICNDFKNLFRKEVGFSDDIVDECLDFIEDCFEEIDEELLEDEEFMESLIKDYPYLNEFNFKEEEDDDEKEEEEEVTCEECKCEKETKECTCGECKCEEKGDSLEESVVSEDITTDKEDKES